MAAFDFLSDPFLERDAAGNRVFYPYGIFGRGRILPDEAAERRVRSFYGLMIGLAVIYGVVSAAIGDIWIGVGIALLTVAATQLGVAALVHDYPLSDTRLKFSEQCANSWRAIGPRIGWLGIGVCTVGTVVAGIRFSGADTQAEFEAAAELGGRFVGAGFAFAIFLFLDRRARRRE